MPLPQDIQETQYEDTPRGWYLRMAMELEHAKKKLSKWHERCEKITKRYTDDREAIHDTDNRLNLFTANIKMQKCMLYGKVPQASVERRFADAKDADARVAGELLERLLNTDIHRDADGFSSAMGYTLDDFLLYDFGNSRLRYVCDWEETDNEKEGEDEAPIAKPAITRPHPQTGEPMEMAPAVPQVPQKAKEDVETVYVFWKDQLWSPARTFEDVRLWFFKAQMSREQLKERFPKQAGSIPLNSKRGDHNPDTNAQQADPWQRADVWEVWDKECKKVRWFVEGYPEILEEKDDPLQLEGFWPFPKPVGFENSTTSELVPVPDFTLAQDLYTEADTLSSRIAKVQKAIRVAGIYDKTAGSSVGRLVNEAGQNELIAVENWASLVEKGGVKGLVDWLPLDVIVAALDKLRDMRQEVIQLIYQVTGMSDIMRGQQSENGTPGEAQAKARFASIIMQAKQDEFARYASDMQRLKAEIISKHFDVQTILERSNALMTWDAEKAVQAAQLIKDSFPSYRVAVKPEAISMTDFAAMKSERMEVLGMMTSFMQAAAPLAMQQPASAPFMLQLLQWAIAGLKGASSAEGILDQAITASQQAAQQAAQQPQQPPPPDPKLQTVLAKNQGDLQKIQAETQSEMVRQQAETEQLAQRDRNAAAINIQEEQTKAHIKAAVATHAASLVPPKPEGGGFP